MGWEFACAGDALAAGGCLGTELGGQYVALYNLDGRYYATSDLCTHQVALLSGGHVDGEFIECPMHQGRFHIPTGTPQGDPVTEPLKTYPVKLEGGRIFVLMDESDKSADQLFGDT